MNEKVLKPNLLVGSDPYESNLTGVELKHYYNNLSKFVADEFRKAVMERCDWTYPVWLTRIGSKTKITKLESEAIKPLMNVYKTPNVA